MNTGSGNDDDSDPLADALCRQLPDRWWLEPSKWKRQGEQAAALCLTSCPVLDECRKWTRWHKPFDRPYQVAQAGVWWPDLINARVDDVPDWWPVEEPRPPWLR